jgi:hypothetical protein
MFIEFLPHETRIPFVTLIRMTLPLAYFQPDWNAW